MPNVISHVSEASAYDYMHRDWDGLLAILISEPITHVLVVRRELQSFLQSIIEECFGACVGLVGEVYPNLLSSNTLALALALADD